VRYFKINILGNDQDRKLAFVDEAVQDCPDAYRVVQGRAYGADYPADARIYLQRESPGIKLSSVLGNTVGYLIVNTTVKTIMQGLDLGNVEILPFTLYDHKKRSLSKDYWIVNPVGTVDCVDRSASVIKLLDGDPKQIIAVKKFVLDSKKLATAPDLFRVPEEPQHYFVSQRIPMALQGKGITNFYIEEIDVA
jgi:hypothetical protein